MKDREVFKKIYSTKKRAEKNIALSELKEKIIRKFPKLGKVIKMGFGTEDASTVKVHAEEQFEPNLTISPREEDLCYIRVFNLGPVNPKSGGLWILKKKFELDKLKNAKTWYYWSRLFEDDLIIDINSVKLHKEKIKVKNPTGRVGEEMMILPVTLAKHEKELFWWIEKELKEKYPEYLESTPGSAQPDSSDKT